MLQKVSSQGRRHGGEYRTCDSCEVKNARETCVYHRVADLFLPVQSNALVPITKGQRLGEDLQLSLQSQLRFES